MLHVPSVPTFQLHLQVKSLVSTFRVVSVDCLYYSLAAYFLNPPVKPKKHKNIFNLVNRADPHVEEAICKYWRGSQQHHTATGTSNNVNYGF